MKNRIQQYSIPCLAGACVLAGLAVIPAMILPGAPEVERAGLVGLPVLDQEALNEEPPSVQSVLAGHLFVPAREATGQNSFPDLIVKGVYVGTENNALFSLKSKPQANLRIWADNVSAALDQVVDPKDPRQPIVEFLREWSIEKIDFEGVTLKHFITGEVETYAVDYTPEKKVKDDAMRGYGQGAIPQGGGDGTATASATQRSGGGKNSSAAEGPRTPPAGTPEFMADRVSSMVRNMSPEMRQRFMQRVQQPNGAGETGGNGGATKNSSKKSAGKTSQAKKKK